MGKKKKKKKQLPDLAGSPRILVYLEFSRATVIYTDSYEVIIDGPLWPREMQASIEIIKLYKEQSRESNGKK